MKSKPTQTKTIHKKWMEDPEYARAYFQEKFIQEVEEKLLACLEQKGIGQSELAKKLGKSRAYMSQVFSGSRNMTLRTVAELCWALDVEPRFALRSNTDVNAGRASESERVPQ